MSKHDDDVDLEPTFAPPDDTDTVEFGPETPNAYDTHIDTTRAHHRIVLYDFMASARTATVRQQDDSLDVDVITANPTNHRVAARINELAANDAPASDAFTLIAAEFKHLGDAATQHFS